MNGNKAVTKGMKSNERLVVAPHCFWMRVMPQRVALVKRTPALAGLPVATSGAESLRRRLAR